MQSLQNLFRRYTFTGADGFIAETNQPVITSVKVFG